LVIGVTGTRTKDILEIFNQKKEPMFFATSTKDSVNYNIEPIDNIQIGDIIHMNRTGKRFSVESITPTGVVLREQCEAVSFSRSALNERLKRENATHIAF